VFIFNIDERYNLTIHLEGGHLILIISDLHCSYAVDYSRCDYMLTADHTINKSKRNNQ
jgi:hypothetical protein